MRRTRPLPDLVMAPPASLFLAARMLAGDNPEEGHELARLCESAQVVNLGDDHPGGERADATQATQASNHVAERPAAGDGLDVIVQVFDLPVEVEPCRCCAAGSSSARLARMRRG